VVTGLIGDVAAGSLTGALTVTTGNATDNTISITTGTAATSITASGAGDTITVDGTALLDNTALTLAGSAAEVVTGLIGDVAAASLTGALTVTTGDATDDTISITTGSAATSITASGADDTISVDATKLANNTALTLIGSAAETVTGLIGNIAAGSLTGALTVTTGDATDNTISITTGSAATSITDSFASDTVTVNATALADDTALTLSGAAGFTVTGLQGDLTATSVGGTLNVTSVDVASGLSIATGSGSNTITATALTAGHLLTLTGSSAATVTLNAGDLSAITYSGNITVTGGAAANTITIGNGGGTITGGGGADTLTGGSGNDIFNFSTAANLAAAMSIAGGAGSDTIRMTAAATLTDTDFLHATSIETLGLTGASTVTLSTNAATTGITNVTTGNGATSLTTTATGPTALTIDATALANNTALTLVGSAAETVSGLIGNITASSLTGALTVATGDATDNTISVTTGSAATSITDSFATDTVTVNATALADNTALTLSGAAGFTVTGLKGDLTATSVSGALNVTSVDVASGLSIATGGGSNTITATALTAGHVLTLTGSSAATVTLNAGNLSAGTYSGNITVTGGATANTITVGSGDDTITGGGGADTLTGGAGSDTFKYNLTSDSTLVSPDTITDFTHNSDKIDVSAITGITAVQGLISGATQVLGNSIAWIVVGSNTVVLANATASSEVQGLADMEIILTGNSLGLAGSDFMHAPAGVSGHAINLALTDPSPGQDDPITVTITGAPSDWSLNAGTSLVNGSWTVQTNDPAALMITPSTTFTGAMLIGVTESWTNPDGSAAAAYVMDNVEAYAPGLPIFALAGDDHLTGAGGNDLFVFAQPIGHDDIYNFSPASDRIDLIGFAHARSFGDIQANLADDANGDAVIALGDGQSITLRGVDASLLTAGNFVFDQTPIVDNAGRMDIGDDAMLPLSGNIDNTGTIALNSIGHETDLQLIGHGVTLSGGGQVILSDNSQNVISGTDPSVTLTNVDNTISGAGHLGNGLLTLINEGTIIANGNNPLVIDTGANLIANSGTMQSTGAGGLIITSDIANSGLLWADGGNITIHGNVSGAGSAVIDGSAVLEFAGADSSSVIFHSATGELILDHSADFTGTISGFTGDGTLAGSDQIDLRDINFSSLEQSSYANGVLTVSDGTHTANLDFNGDYQLANFKFVDDGQGGTTVYDPPITGESAPTTGDITKYAPADTATTDTIATDRATFLKDTVANFKSDADKIAQSFSDQMQHILNTAHDGHGSAATSTDALSAAGTKSAQSLQASMADAKSGFESLKDTASNHNSTWGTLANGTLNGNDAFVFKPNFGHDTSANFNPARDSITTDHTIANDFQHLLDTSHHDVGTNPVTAAGANTVLHDVFKNQLLQHVSDFHFV
jgi:Ca2+-binding RTX toxin-like protein